MTAVTIYHPYGVVRTTMKLIPTWFSHVTSTPKMNCLTINMSIFFDYPIQSTLTKLQDPIHLMTSTIQKAPTVEHPPTYDKPSAKDARQHDEPTIGVTPESLVTAVTPTTSLSYRHVTLVGSGRIATLPGIPTEVPS